MRGLIRMTMATGAFLAGTGAIGLHYWPIGNDVPASFPEGDALQGAYLARASGCVGCHTNIEDDGLALAGGAPLDTPFGTFIPPNITPHPNAGIGKWTIQDFARAVRQGISPDGKPYYPVFTYSFYSTYTDQQIADLWEAFRTVPAVAEHAGDHDVRFPFGFRGGLKLWRAVYLDTPQTDALMGASDDWNRGRLLVEGPAHCAACHTGRNLAGGLKRNAALAGNNDLPGGNKAPSIRAGDLVENGWSIANLSYALKLGILPNGDVFGGSMAEVVNNGTAFLTDEDRTAIATYLLAPEGAENPAVSLAATPSNAATVDHSNMNMAPTN